MYIDYMYIYLVIYVYMFLYSWEPTYLVCDHG